MFFELWKEIFIKRGINSISPILLKILSDKNVNALMIKALNLRADIKEMVETQTYNIAKSLDLVTREELVNLKMNVRELESQIENLKKELLKKEKKTKRVEKKVEKKS